MITAVLQLERYSDVRMCLNVVVAMSVLPRLVVTCDRGVGNSMWLVTTDLWRMRRQNSSCR